ncbi:MULTISPECIES: sirohydrochlorin chelatase [Nostocales]|uniref:Cobalamin biosynthesis protein n=3 Tax=Nostocales TaxID=1161 RepID=A0A0C1R7Y5_9CYAN|nr:sirohydrochlorin chelatase [Tolypothrix bouteillei]KAF3884743.1 sirohydrochlorin chelatase [Tolypothrix bouteillei VB521301]
MPSAYLLVSHGSHDPRPEIAMQRLAGLLHHKLEKYLPSIVSNDVAVIPDKSLVGTAYLELNPEPLHEQIKTFSKNALALGCCSLKILPLFLLPGVHVMEDIPVEVALAQQSLDRGIKIYLQPYLGSHPGLKFLLVKQLVSMEVEGKILLAHGSRRLGSVLPVEAMATSLSAVTAYWAHPPSLESRVQELVTAGCRRIAILPYFLFAGGITDAIAGAQEKLKLLFPEVSFQLADPLGTSAELADLIWDLVEQ